MTISLRGQFVLLLVLCSAPLHAQGLPDLLISSRGTDAIARYSGSDGTFIDLSISEGEGDLSAPQEMLLLDNGSLIVTGRFNEAILRFNLESGEYLGPFTSGYTLSEPTKTTFGPDGNLYVSQWGGQMNKVARFDGTTGAFIDEFTSTDLNFAMGHAWDEEGRLYVVNFGSRDVRRFDTDGSFIDVFASGNLSGPVNLWFSDDYATLYVQDWTNGTVKRFNGETGAFIDVFISGLVRTEGFAYGADGLLYVADWAANVVNRYDAETGEFVDTFIDGDGVFTNPNSLFFLPLSVDSENAVPERSLLDLGQSHPNPAATSVTIPYSLAEGAEVSLRVLDVLGREVAVLARGFRAAGPYTATLERGVLPAGVYVYQLRAGDRTESRRLTLLR